MDITKMLEELRRERQQIEEAILTLERLASGRGRRRGRPPLGCRLIRLRAIRPQRRGRLSRKQEQTNGRRRVDPTSPGLLA